MLLAELFAVAMYRITKCLCPVNTPLHGLSFIPASAFIGMHKGISGEDEVSLALCEEPIKLTKFCTGPYLFVVNSPLTSPERTSRLLSYIVSIVKT